MNRLELKRTRMMAYRKAFPNVMLYALAKQRARQKNLKFAITPEDIVIPKRCPVLGITLAHGKNKRPRPTSPTLDRIIPSKGYVRGNIIVISSLANRVKSTANWSQILAVGYWLKRLTSRRVRQ